MSPKYKVVNAVSAKTGKKVKLKYVVEQVLGVGSFGQVFRVRTSGGAVYAFKEQELSPRTRFREISMSLVMKHPNLVRLFYYKLKRDRYCLSFMDYLPSNLSQVVQKYSERGESIPRTKQSVYMFQLLRGLAFMHRRDIAHRDLKPENIVVNDEICELKICDFGSAKVINDGCRNQPYICSRWYRAPELLMGSRNYSVNVDLWSAGCILLELVKLRVCFNGTDSLDQLTRYVTKLGPPSPLDLEAIEPETNVSFLQDMSSDDSTEQVNASSVGDSVTYELSRSLLQYNPHNRISAWDALFHRFFTKVHSHLSSSDVKKFLAWTKEEEKLLQSSGEITNGAAYFETLSNNVKWDEVRVTDGIQCLFPETERLDVEVYIAVMNLGELDIKKSSFTIDMLLFAKWTESTQSCREDLTRLHGVGLVPEDSNVSHFSGNIMQFIWTPCFQISEAEKMTVSDEVNPTVAVTIDHSSLNRKGCSYSMKLRQQGTINCKTDFDNYPFDVQTCPLTISSYTEDDTRLKLTWKVNRGDAADNRNNLLKMLEYRVEFHQYEDSGVHWSFPPDWTTLQGSALFHRFQGVRLEIKFHRLLTNMFYNAYLPCILLAIVGVTSLFMNIRSFSERIILITSVLLSFYTIYGSLSVGLPRANIMTYLDQFLLCDMVFMILVTLEPIAVHWYLCRLRRIASKRATERFEREKPAFFIVTPLRETIVGNLKRTESKSEGAKSFFRSHGQPDEDQIQREARRFDSLLKYPLIVVMISYLIVHFVGTY
ncbi:microtubule-associated serine/threonine-protein kinase 4-like [Galendromus occidentalis]|uniref:Microtubule-associated serine/threonine-protein kinase 4-like n=1 Tax=Galendromus occidentalis TaxID=34638 RepID=A0AAJ7P8Y6_9ACAR|nr:microtubule-associated serine/threonine-protein kinase 4-like [Galendromus occidentalis]